MKSSAELALHAYDTRPTRAESLYQLAKQFREQGLNQASLIFSERGLAIPYPAEDLLFVEDEAYRWGLRNEFSICAYYSDEHRDRGREVCDGLALDRSIPAWVRDQSRRNLYWYAQQLREIAPSFAHRQIDCPAMTDWYGMNPSVARLGDQMPCVLRMVNYWIDQNGRYCMPRDETRIRTRNFLGHIDADSLEWTLEGEISADLGEPLYDQVLGLEDMRLFSHQGQLRFVAAARQFNAGGRSEQILGILGRTITHTTVLPGWQAMKSPVPNRHEKNWMPLVDAEELAFVYLCDPMIVVGPHETLSQTGCGLAADNFSGSSQLIPFDGGWLAVIHEKIHNPTHGRATDNQFRFVRFDAELRMKHVSPRWWLHNKNRIEYVCGLCSHPDGERLVLSYGIHDAEAWVATISQDDVRRLLDSGTYFTDLPATPAIHEPTPLRVNQPLLCVEQVDDATRQLELRCLPHHPDRVKNWDTWLALKACDGLAEDSLIMDAGGTRQSAFLPALRRFGHTNLFCFNIDEPRFGVDFLVDGHIRYLYGDITELPIVGNGDRFSFVACLSVIEHGVDWQIFLTEMARILRPDGKLFLSFDYWHRPIDCREQVAFGAPVKIFAPVEVQALVDYAATVGLELTGGELDLRCRDKVVNWIGLDFTFMCLLFRRG